jgi:PII-like signaling protein
MKGGRIASADLPVHHRLSDSQTGKHVFRMIQKSLVERGMRGVLVMRPFVTVFAEDRALNRCTVRAPAIIGNNAFPHWPKVGRA